MSSTATLETMASEIPADEPAQHPGPEAFRALMKALRKGAGNMSQRKAADLCDLSQAIWARNERGWGQNQSDPVTPSPYVVSKVAAGFGQPRDALLRIAGYDPADHPEDTGATIKMPPSKVIEVYNDLNENQAKAWLIMGRLLKNPNAVVNWSTLLGDLLPARDEANADSNGNHA